MKLSEEHVALLNIQQEVLRCVVISLGCLNPSAMPAVAAALRHSGSDGRSGPTASKLLLDLAGAVEQFDAEQRVRRH